MLHARRYWEAQFKQRACLCRKNFDHVCCRPATSSRVKCQSCKLQSANLSKYRNVGFMNLLCLQMPADASTVAFLCCSHLLNSIADNHRVLQKPLELTWLNNRPICRLVHGSSWTATYTSSKGYHCQERMLLGRGKACKAVFAEVALCAHLCYTGT